MVSSGFQPKRCAFSANRERSLQRRGTAVFQGTGRITQERLRHQEHGVLANRRHGVGAAAGQDGTGNAHVTKQPQELVFHRIGQGTRNQQVCLVTCIWQILHQAGEAGVFALRECGFNAAAGIIQYTDVRQVLTVQALGCALQIQLDDFRWAGAHKEQHLDVRAAVQQAVDHAVQFVIDVGEACEVALINDGSGKARLGENHHASC